VQALPAGTPARADHHSVQRKLFDATALPSARVPCLLQCAALCITARVPQKCRRVLRPWPRPFLPPDVCCSCSVYCACCDQWGGGSSCTIRISFDNLRKHNIINLSPKRWFWRVLGDWRHAEAVDGPELPPRCRHASPRCSPRDQEYSSSLRGSILGMPA
jgi:hypothetical protein